MFTTEEEVDAKSSRPLHSVRVHKSIVAEVERRDMKREKERDREIYRSDEIRRERDRKKEEMYVFE